MCRIREDAGVRLSRLWSTEIGKGHGVIWRCSSDAAAAAAADDDDDDDESVVIQHQLCICL